MSTSSGPTLRRSRPRRASRVAGGAGAAAASTCAAGCDGLAAPVAAAGGGRGGACSGARPVLVGWRATARMVALRRAAPGCGPTVGDVLVVTRHRLPLPGFAAAADGARRRCARCSALLAERPGYVRGWLTRAVDDPDLLVLAHEWADVGSYRRALSAYEVKLRWPVPADRGRRGDGVRGARGADARTPSSSAASARGADADTVGLGARGRAARAAGASSDEVRRPRRRRAPARPPCSPPTLAPTARCSCRSAGAVAVTGAAVAQALGRAVTSLADGAHRRRRARGRRASWSRDATWWSSTTASRRAPPRAPRRRRCASAGAARARARRARVPAGGRRPSCAARYDDVVAVERPLVRRSLRWHYDDVRVA